MNQTRALTTFVVLTFANAVLQLGCSDNSPHPDGPSEAHAGSSGAGASLAGQASSAAGTSAATSGGASGSSSGGAGGNDVGGVAGVTGTLGAACAHDTDCNAGLSCVTANSGKLGNDGPAHGLCTVTCVQGDSTCERFGAGSACVYFGADQAYCLEGCSLGVKGEAKCHGRAEMGCASVYDADSEPIACAGGSCAAGADCIEGFCFARSTACLPQCNSDPDCGAGLYCNRGTAFGGMGGLCRTQAASGAATGTPCTPEANTCRGACVQLGDGSVCADGCSIGAVGACDATAATVTAACVYTFDDEAGTGDAAACVKLCDCDDDCQQPSLKCVAFAADSPSRKFGRAGHCDVAAAPSIACK